MFLKDWAYLGSHEFFTNRLRLLSANDLSPEKWSYAGKNDFGILRNYLCFTFDKFFRKEKRQKNLKSNNIFIWTIVLHVLTRDCTTKHGNPFISTVKRTLFKVIKIGNSLDFIIAIPSDTKKSSQMM